MKKNDKLLRQSNIELLRIISMLGIISLHYFNSDFGGVGDTLSFPGVRWIFAYAIISMSIPLVNCFVLITGYFMGKQRELSIGKICELLLITAFYGIVSYFIACLKGLTDFSAKGLIFAIIPFLEGKRWFVETYLILLLVAPFINIIVAQCEKRALIILIIIQISLFSIWYSIGYSAPVLDDGYGIINFITLYLIGAYIRKYGGDLKLPRSRNCIILFVFVCMITFSLNLRINPFGYAFITNILAAICIFVGFLKWEISSNSFINQLSSCGFDVYFIHTDKILGKYLFQNVLKSTSLCGDSRLYVHWLLTITVIYVLGMIVGSIRKYIFSSIIYSKMRFARIVKKKIPI